MGDFLKDTFKNVKDSIAGKDKNKKWYKTMSKNYLVVNENLEWYLFEPSNSFFHLHLPKLLNSKLLNNRIKITFPIT